MIAPGIRWTIGDVSPAGYEALRLSVHGAARLFGAQARYLICVNTVPLDEARRRCGELPLNVEWRQIAPTIPDVLRGHLDDEMAEGVGWKFLPLRAFPERPEIALDNDVILWELPPAIKSWLGDNDQPALISADVTPAYGCFAGMCGSEPRNSGIRGIKPDLDYAAALGEALRRNPAQLRSELDEQGLQVAALSLHHPPAVVPVSDVSICSPFHPHSPQPGSCGAHFVGLNSRDLPWRYYDRPATELRAAHWRAMRPRIYPQVGLDPP
jgi:hypothetical protein